MKHQANSLFGDIDQFSSWSKEWQGMPEFIQQKKEPFAKIILRVESKENLDELSKLLGQKLTPKTKSIWFPFKSHWGLEKKEWESGQ
jgi:hypothetical protein